MNCKEGLESLESLENVLISLEKSSKGFGKKKMFRSRSRTELIFSLVFFGKYSLTFL